MNKLIVLLSFLTLSILVMVSCGDKQKDKPKVEEKITDTGISNVIPANLGKVYTKSFI